MLATCHSETPLPFSRKRHRGRSWFHAHGERDRLCKRRDRAVQWREPDDHFRERHAGDRYYYGSRYRNGSNCECDGHEPGARRRHIQRSSLCDQQPLELDGHLPLIACVNDLRGRAVLRSMALSAEGNQIGSTIVAERAASSQVVNVEILKTAAHLTAPVIARQDFLMQLGILDCWNSDSRSLLRKRVAHLRLSV
jgi:hypothetical protein